MQTQLRTLILCLVVVSGTAEARWGHKKAPVPPPPPPAPVYVPPPPPPPPVPLDFSGIQTAPPQPAPLDSLQAASLEVQDVARWVNTSHDNAGMPFLLIDKTNAQVYAFNALGQLQAKAPALLGMAKGDRLLAPNTATMSQMPPKVRITPAGRYVSRLAIDSHGKELLVINYDASISLHPVVKGTPVEHRAERLASVTADDNRVSFGCINVPPAFYSTIVSPDFTQRSGIVYILPETSRAGELFGFAPSAPAVPEAQQVSTGSGPEASQALPATGAK